MENELVELVLQDTRERMAKVIEHAKSEFASVRTGRASSSLIENLMVDYYGADTALKQLANFSVPEPRLLVVSAYAGAAPGPAASNPQAQNASTVEVGSRVLGPLATELC